MISSKEMDVEQLRLLINILIEIHTRTSLDEILTALVNYTGQVSRCSSAWILLFDPQSQRFTSQAVYQADPAARQNWLTAIPAESLAGSVARKRAPVFCANIQNDDQFSSLVRYLPEDRVHSLAAIPMQANQNLVGVLGILDPAENRLDPQQMGLLEFLAMQAALVIVNFRQVHQAGLMAEMVHELRTPLTSIMAISYLLQREEIATSQRISLAATIHQECERLNEITTAYLDLSRYENAQVPLSLSHFNLVDLLLDCCQLVQPNIANHKLQLTLPETNPALMVSADRDQIRQVILNLLTNSIKYNVPNGKIQVHAWKEEGGVAFSVSDTGMGIPSDALAHLFEKYYRARQTEKQVLGTGLGLSVCRRIIENHHGRIEVESEVQHGATFTVHLPAEI